MERTRKGVRRAALLCAFMLLAFSMAINAAGASANPAPQSGMISVESLERVASEYPNVPDEFLDAIEGEVEISVSLLKKLATAHSLPTQYFQRFIDDSFVFKMGNQFQYIPVDPSLSRHSYDWAFLDEWYGEKEYVVNQEERAVKVIDVSSYQGNIDWDAVKSGGVDYAFIRLGNRGYTKGALNLDKKFDRNMQRAAAAGVKVGVYFYSQAVSRAEAREEAAFVLDALRGYDLDLPVVFDIEGAQNRSYRTYGLSTQTKTDIVKAFCGEIEEAGYDVMYYSYCKFLIEQLDMSQLEQYDLWMAQYYEVPFFPYNFKIWQYDYKGSVDGISTPVDMNLMFLDYVPNAAG
ncbi:MAG: glycoside hydrolase family 25 protein [Oscillospiraceae bacterium]|nr:glycoside hydrolase family 25 protein [Oscillospiraceae bacterium]